MSEFIPYKPYEILIKPLDTTKKYSILLESGKTINDCTTDGFIFSKNNEPFLVCDVCKYKVQ